MQDNISSEDIFSNSYLFAKSLHYIQGRKMILNLIVPEGRAPMYITDAGLIMVLACPSMRKMYIMLMGEVEKIVETSSGEVEDRCIGPCKCNAGY